MIRSNLPLPFLYRLRLQAGAAARQATSSPVNYRQGRPQSAGARPAERPFGSDPPGGNRRRGPVLAALH